MLEKIEQASRYLEKNLNERPDIGLILGSGLGLMANEIKDSKKVSYSDIPNFPVSTVKGHAGRLISGILEGKNVITMQGRFHYYEGYDMKELTLPIRVMEKLGINKLLVTNAAGGINVDFAPGDFMIIKDHINHIGDNPLIGQNYEKLGPRFPDMTRAYNEDLRNMAETVAKDLDISIQKGIYIAVHGPSYETPAEIKYFRKIGADAVGMSTVPEVIVANHMDLEVLGISCITNMAAGVLPEPLNHEDVMEIAEKAKPDFIKLVRGILRNM